MQTKAKTKTKAKVRTHTPKDEDFWERIADRSEELANLTRPHSGSLTKAFEFAALLALDKKES